MNELLELIKRFNEDKNVYVMISYFKPCDAYEIELREYDHNHYVAHRVKNLIRVDDLLSVTIPTHEVFVTALNRMYKELKGHD